ncbi:hypothetical protein BN000_04330 [Mycobacterium europaeum]|uniref:Uncharacterized protein n=1 Tax=Mycobacterium europaeum TaxID=761804 RepID=A0A0U1DN58_9MYCO|nr:hypothetical protein [Mycobacterium europaeum]CQD18858.1 hypothetical protein BN000_04330 [Mycobacterium europaeum]
MSSEGAFELSPDTQGRASMEAEIPVSAAASTLGPKGASSLGLCTLTCERALIGTATVRSYFVGTDDLVLDEPDETVSGDT